MRAPLSWLRDYAPLDAPLDVLGRTLSELGLVVEGVEEVGGGLDDVVVCRILAIRAHPDADRIRLVDVDPGDGGPLQIVCGAWNFAEGDLVPLAPVGAVLPGDFKIAKRKMRGEVSNGMLCSASELELPSLGAEDGLLILDPGLAPPGTPLVTALGLMPDVVFDLDITANRPDALCMAGIARDLAAALGETWSAPASPSLVPVDEALGAASIVVSAGDLCPRFTGTLLTGVPKGPSTPEMARRLRLAGMRPINAVVDMSNYVMLDIGQPNHAYDLDRLSGGGILVRRGRPDEQMTTLDGVSRALGPDDCLICSADGTPVGIGAIMGGAAAEITDGTSNVLLECAWFDPAAVARTGNRLGLTSEARSRFERGVDPAVAPAAVERFCALLATMPGGTGLRRGPTTDVMSADLPASSVVDLRVGRVNSLLGVSLAADEVESLLSPLGFRLAPVAGGSDAPGVPGPSAFSVTVPTWRLEVAREADLIEEVARMYGYGRIERTVPAGARRRTGGLTAYQKERRRVRSILAGAGLFEAWTNSFLAPEDLIAAGLDPSAVEVENPLDRGESVLRSSLRPGLLKALRYNVDRQLDGLALFEIGRVFLAAGADLRPLESELLGVAILPPAGLPSATAVESAVRAWQWLAAGLRLDTPALAARPVPGLHPGRSASVLVSAAEVGAIGEVDPDVVAEFGLPGPVGWLQVDLEELFSASRLPAAAVEVSRFPASDVDLAFVVSDAVPAASLVEGLRAAGGSVVESAVLFDTYRDAARLGPDRRSLAVHLRLRAPDHTLTEAELTSVRESLIEAGVALGGELTGSVRPSPARFPVVEPGGHPCSRRMRAMRSVR
jgi:phenylalanyl-tRNA synthetase beta chain